MNDLERKGREAWSWFLQAVVIAAILIIVVGIPFMAVFIGLLWLFDSKGLEVFIVSIMALAFLLAIGEYFYAMLYALVAPVLRLFRKKPMRTIQPHRQEGNIPLAEIERAVEEVVARRTKGEEK